MSEIKNVLVTGGAGYIGSHTVVLLVEQGYEPIIVDNLSNSSIKVLDRLEKITGKKIKFYKADVCSKDSLRKIFSENKIDAVIHFAGLKAVGESVQKPLMYYRNNIDSSLSLMEVMNEFNCKNLIFSSSATVYGVPKHVPLVETDEVGGTTNPYGTTKVIIEGIIKDYCAIDPSFNAALLRYFNPIGAHKSGLIGEQPNGIPNNLMPYITQVAIGKREKLRIFGNDYNTVDGTGVRDYIHVMDLALGHVLALKKLSQDSGLVIYNLGTGKGTSVLELVHAYEQATGVKIPYEIVERRPGDVDSNYASTDKAFNELGFKAQYTIYDACYDSNNWQTKNPQGYDD